MFLEEGSRQMSAGLSFGYRTINKLKNSLPYIYGNVFLAIVRERVYKSQSSMESPGGVAISNIFRVACGLQQ